MNDIIIRFRDVHGTNDFIKEMVTELVAYDIEILGTCKDCKYSIKSYCEMNDCIKPDDYCSYWEKKDEATIQD